MVDTVLEFILGVAGVILLAGGSLYAGVMLLLPVVPTGHLVPHPSTKDALWGAAVAIVGVIVLGVALAV